MNVYVETNFVLELVFQQEQSASCEAILDLCRNDNVDLFIPAYCLAEPHEKLRRQNANRQELQNVLNAELRQLARTSTYAERIRSIQEITSLLVQSTDDERERLDRYRTQIIQTATVIPLIASILSAAATYEGDYNFAPQDALVYASVTHHLSQSNATQNCFLNRNSRDFDNSDIAEALTTFNCKMIPRFDDGYRYIQTQIKKTQGEIHVTSTKIFNSSYSGRLCHAPHRLPGRGPRACWRCGGYNHRKWRRSRRRK